MKHLEVLRADLERLFDLDELKSLCRDVLGFEPDSVGGTATLGSFAGALVEFCAHKDAVDALADALRSTGRELSPGAMKLAAAEPAEDEALATGTELGPFKIVRRLGEGRLGTTYVAKFEGRDVRLKVLAHEAARDRRGTHRLFVAARLASRLEGAGLPRLLHAGPAGDREVLAHEYVEGQPLSARVQRTGPMHINEARAIIVSVARTLVALHERSLVHGSLSLDNVITFRNPAGEPAALLLDVGTDRLRVRQSRHRKGLSSTGGNPRTVSPEQIRGADADARSDLYSLGATLYELLTGKPPFEGEILETAFSHLVKQPAPASAVAPRGWITPDIDALLLRLLSKNPEARGTSRDILHELEDLGRARRADQMSDQEFSELEQALLADPGNSDAQLALENAVARGVAAERVGQAFRLAASMIDDPIYYAHRKHLLLRAARLLETKQTTLETAEDIYVELLGAEPHDPIAFAGLEEIRRRLGKSEELVEMFLFRAESAGSALERARAMAEIGRLYLREMSDSEQATVAFAQAFVDDPREEYAADIERAAGSNEQLWAEALASVGEASQNPELGPEARTLLLLKAGVWYRTKVHRPDLALPCFQAVLGSEPSNEVALSGLTDIYRNAQQWQELGMILNHRANAAATPALARDLRTEAASVLENKIGDLGGARAVYELVLSEDPSHPQAGEALVRILDRSGDFPALVALLEKRILGQSTSDAVRTLCRIGEIYEERLSDLDEATARYRRAQELEPQSLDALRGLERIYTKLGKYRDLVDNLERQVALAATPKQRVTLLERIAAVYEEEFLDQTAAARVLERALAVDPSRQSAIASLIRHYRVLSRFEDASALYEKQLATVDGKAERISLAMAWGRLLADQLANSERAVRAFELVLDLDPEHQGALEALAKARETSGDAERALEAILALADQAETREARSEHYLRAAKMLESRGNLGQAIEYFQSALEQTPEDRAISQYLRAAYVKRGEIHAAIELLEREIEVVEGDRQQAKLMGELARLQREKLRDNARAEASAERALRLDASNVDALLVLGDLCFEQKRFVEASAHYGRASDRLEHLGPEVAVPVLERFVDAVGHTGSTEGAAYAVEVLLRLAPNDVGVLGRAARVTFEHGTPEAARDLLTRYLAQGAAQISDRERATATFRLGESLRKSGDIEGAIAKLEEASELDPGSPLPLQALAQAYADASNFPEVVRAKTRQLDLADSDERVQLLLDIGDLCATKLGDRTQATRSYVAALEERPDDRRLLTKLMQLYSEDKDWNKLIDIVEKLAEFVEEPAQKVKYLHTAALVSGRQLGDVARAIGYFEQVLDFDPSNVKAQAELTDLHLQTKNFPAAAELLERQAAHQKDPAALLSTYDKLAEIYGTHLANREKAAQIYEAAFALDREDKDRLEKLAAIYATDPDTFRDKGIALQEFLLQGNPFRHESYKALRKIYTVGRNADASFAICQALTVLGLAEPDEERFYQRMRAETAAPAQEALNEEDWHLRVAHPTLNSLLTSVFALIEPAVIRARALPIEQLGLTPEHQIDPAQHEAPLAQTLYYAAGVLGVPAPAVYVNPADPGGLSFLGTEYPAVTLGRVGLSSQVPPQVAAFVAARQLAYCRPGLYLRHFIQTGTALKAWLFAAIKLSSPQFPVAADIEGSVVEALAALRQFLPSDSKDHLSSVVSKLIQSGTALDLKKWVAAADLTADRAGFVVAHDLDTAIQVVRASDESTALVSNQERFKELVLFASSSSYITLRRRLSITVDA